MSAPAPGPFLSRWPENIQPFNISASISPLEGGTDGLDLIRRLIPLAFHLTPCLLLECGPDQAQKVAALAREAGFTNVAIHPDLTHRPRIVEARRS